MDFTCFGSLSIHLNAAESQSATIIGKELSTYHAAY
jgi:hypothetical protein